MKGSFSDRGRHVRGVGGGGGWKEMCIGVCIEVNGADWFVHLKVTSSRPQRRQVTKFQISPKEGPRPWV